MSRTLLAVCCVSLFVVPANLVAQTRKEPLTTFLFSLKIPNTSEAFFRSLAGLSSESEVVEYKSGSETDPVQKIPGRLKYGNITLKRGITTDTSMAISRKLVEDGQIQQARRNGSLILLDKSNTELARWSLINAWPSKLTIDLDEETGDPVEVVVLAVEVIRRQ